MAEEASQSLHAQGEAASGTEDASPEEKAATSREASAGPSQALQVAEAEKSEALSCEQMYPWKARALLRGWLSRGFVLFGPDSTHRKPSGCCVRRAEVGPSLFGVAGRLCYRNRHGSQALQLPYRKSGHSLKGRKEAERRSPIEAATDGSAVYLQVPFCGWEYWLLFGVGCFLLLSFSYYRGSLLKRRQQKLEAAGIPRCPWDMEYNRRFVNAFFVESLLSGIIGENGETGKLPSPKTTFARCRLRRTVRLSLGVFVGGCSGNSGNRGFDGDGAFAARERTAPGGGHGGEHDFRAFQQQQRSRKVHRARNGPLGLLLASLLSLLPLCARRQGIH